MPGSTQHNGNSKASSEVKSNGEATICFEIPKWLTAELFESHLKENVENYRKIREFKAKPGVAAGENYATVMLRINITLELMDGATNSLSYILKVLQDNQHLKDMTRTHNIFDVERRMYYEVIPEFEKLYHDNGTNLKISAKCYNIETPSEFGIVLLEDLCPYGYKNANRLEGLDLEHTEAVLKRLAQWHAASAVRVESKGLYPKLFMSGIVNDTQKQFLGHLIKVNGPEFLKTIKTLKGMDSYTDVVENALDKMNDEISRMSIYDPNEFNVLNHGDCWTNNIMFKYDIEGKLEDTLLIDYQIINYGSPARDLLYFLMSSTHYDIKTKKFDYLIRFYHENLVQNLRLLKYPKKLPSLRDIHIGLIKNGVFGLCTCFCVMALGLLESGSDSNADSMLGESEASNRFRERMYQNPRTRSHLQMLLPWMCNRGFLEI